MLINKKVAGFYLSDGMPINLPKQYCTQIIHIDGKDYCFVYKDLTIPGFMPFKKAKLANYLDELSEKMQNELGVKAVYDEQVILFLMRFPIKWIGIDKADDKKSDYVYITTPPSGKSKKFYREAGRPILSPYYEIFFRPIGGIYV